MYDGIDSLSAADALSREAELLSDVSDNPDRQHLWLWQSPQGLVTPRNLAVKPDFDHAAQTSAQAGWPVEVRSTGGDVTPLGAGIVNVSHVYATSPGGTVSIEQAYHRLCAPIVSALGDGATIGWQPGAFCDGAYNVQWNGKKFAGTAMRFRRCKADPSRYAILAHALMLFEPPTPGAIGALNAFLSHVGEDRVIDLNAHTGLPRHMTPQDFSARLLSGFDNSHAPA